jgi:hypothetical protein
MGGKKQTVTQQSSPWGPAQGYLTGAMGQAQNLYNQGAFAPTPYGFGDSLGGGSSTMQPSQPMATGAASGTGGGGFSGAIGNFLNGMMGLPPSKTRPAATAPQSGYASGAPTSAMGGADLEAKARAAAEMRIPGFGATTQGAMQSIIDRAGQGAPGLDTARSFLTGMMGGGQYEGMQGVRDNILGSAIPAATSMFSGSGLTNSSVAMDGVGRAATEALAPFEYGAWENAQNRGMQAAGMMPGMEQAMYMPAQMQLGMGQMQDQLSQQRASMAQQAYNEAAGMPAANFSPYLNAIMGLGGMGSSGSQTSPVQGTGLGPAVMGGLGMYGTLAGAGLGGGVSGLGGALAALAGLSDRRAKEDITPIGATHGGRALYRYRYKGSPGFHIGVMADENPDMIKGYTNTGFALVDYGRIN